MSQPWAYVAHKDGQFGGVCAVDIDARTLGEFIVEFATDGFTVQPVSDRAEYLALIKDMPSWGSAHSATTSK